MVSSKQVIRPFSIGGCGVHLTPGNAVFLPIAAWFLMNMGKENCGVR
jgi:hypothetical protein